MTIEPVSTELAPQAIGPYSQAVKVAGGPLVFVSGQLAIDPATGQLRFGGIVEQTKLVLENLKAVLEAAGSDLNRVVKTTVYMYDLGEFALMNETYAQFFPGTPPARAAVQVAKLPKGAKVEIDAIALA